jgi:hypothetical protein
MKLIEKILILALLLGVAACGDTEEKGEPEILCEEEDGMLVADRCPGTTSCWRGDVGAGQWECVEQCTAGGCADGERCVGGAFDPPRCVSVPDCDIEASQQDCAPGCQYEPRADRVEVDGETCTLVEENVGACLTPSYIECLNGCPFPTELVELPDGTLLLVTTEAGTSDASETPPPDSCFDLL